MRFSLFGLLVFPFLTFSENITSLDSARHRLDKNPDDQRALLYLGKHEQKGERAAEYLQKLAASRIKGKNQESALFLLGQYYYARGRYSLSVAHFARLIRAYPKGEKKFKALYWLGLGYNAQNKRDSAKTVLFLLKLDDPNGYLRAQVGLGVLAAKAGQIAESNRHLNNALSLGDNSLRSTAYYQLHKNFSGVNDQKNADLFGQKLVREFPNSLEAEKLKKANHGELPSFLNAEGGDKLAVFGKFTLQLGAFSIKENAKRFQERLKLNFDNVEVVEVKKGSASFFLVWLGYFEDREKAERFAKGKLSLSPDEYSIRRRE